MRVHAVLVALWTLLSSACVGDAFVRGGASSVGAGGTATSSTGSAATTGSGGATAGTGGAAIGGGGASSGGGGAGGASVVELEMLTIPSDGSVVSSQSYPSGSSYQIRALGSYTWGGCDPTTCPGGGACDHKRLADAAFQTDDCWTTPTVSTSYGLRLNDQAVFGAAGYSASHNYTVEVEGADAPFVFHIADSSCCYGDNVGSLEVRIIGFAP